MLKAFRRELAEVRGEGRLVDPADIVVVGLIEEALAVGAQSELKRNLPGRVGSDRETMTAKQLARELGITERAVVKRAVALNGWKDGGRWKFERTT